MRSESEDRIIQGDALTELKKLPSDSVDMCITSPPYYALRSYSAGEKEIGQEKTFEEYLNALIAIFAEVKRMLKKEGTIFVNMGDSYAGSGNGAWNCPEEYRGKQKRKTTAGGRVPQEYLGAGTGKKNTGLPDKCLLQIPSRFAVAMTDKLGLTLRNEIIWWKRNSMPSSVKDRFTCDFEKIYFFTKSKKYFFEQQFEPASYLEVWSRKGAKNGTPYEQNNPRKRWGLTRHEIATGRTSGSYSDPLHQKPIYPQGRNMRCVWDIPTTPKDFDGEHYASYPQELVRRCVEAGCPKDGIVLDPFLGSGTTAVVAKKLGRNFIGIELSPAYIEIAEKRLATTTGNLFA